MRKPDLCRERFFYKVNHIRYWGHESRSNESYRGSVIILFPRIGTF